MKKKKLLLPIALASLLSGCFDGHLDCDTDENLEKVTSAIKSNLSYFVRQLGYHDDLRVETELSLKNYEQIKESESVRKCSYEFDVITGNHEVTTNASSEIKNIEKGDRSHKVRDVWTNTYTLTSIARSAVAQSKQIVLEENTSKYGFENTKDYTSFVNLKNKIDEIESEEQQLKSNINKANQEIATTSKALPAEINKLEKHQGELKTLLEGNDTNSFTLLKGVKIKLDNVDIKKQTISGTFTNTNYSDLEYLILKMYVYNKNDLATPIYATYKSTGSFARSKPNTDIMISFTDYDRLSHSTSKEKGVFSKEFYGQLSKDLKRNSTIAKTPSTDLKVLLFPKSFKIDDKSHRGTWFVNKYDIPAKIVSQERKIKKLKQSISHKKHIIEKAQLKLTRLNDKKSTLTAKAMKLNPNKSLELS